MSTIDVETFSVCQILEGGICEWVRLGVDAFEAIAAARHHTANVAAHLGLVKRVIVIDQNDFCVFEWTREDGITFPAEAAGRR